MKSIRAIWFLIPALLLAVPMGHAGEEFYGIIESRPEKQAGDWVIGGRKVAVTDRARLEADNGPFVVGACVEVEYRGKTVVEMSTERKSKCKK